MISSRPAIKCALQTIFLACVFSSAAMALAPEPEPADFEKYSQNGQCIARAQVAEKRILGIRRDGSVETVLWELPKWQRYISISNDCLSLVHTWSFIGPSASSDTVVITFYRDGQKQRK